MVDFLRYLDGEWMSLIVDTEAGVLKILKSKFKIKLD